MVYIFMYAPIVVVIIFSFNKGRFANWVEFDLKWYKMLLSNTAIINAAINSLILAISASTLATVMGTIMAVLLSRYRFIAAVKLNGSKFYLLTVSPDIVMGIALLIFFILIRMPLGFTTLLISLRCFVYSFFVVVTLMGRISKLDEDLVAAARDLGASEGKAFLHVILPLLPPAAIRVLLSFTLSMDDVLISFFVAGPGFEILPFKIYSMVKLGIKPDINALSAIMFAITVVFVLTAQFLLRTRR